MSSLAQARAALLGGFLFLLGLAVSGVLQGNSNSSVSHAQNFDTTRGQMGYLLRSVQHRKVGMGLMMVGAGILSYAVLRKK